MAELGSVVDLAVVHDVISAVASLHGHAAALRQINNREAARAEPDAGAYITAGIVRPAVYE